MHKRERKPLSIYVLDEELEALERDMLEAGGVITEEMEDAYGELLEMREDKVEGYIKMYRRLKGGEVAWKEELERVKGHYEAFRNSSARLKDRLRQSMQRRGDVRYETPVGNVALQNNGGKTPVSVRVEFQVEPDTLPDAFKRVTIEPDVDALRSALEGKEGALAQQAAELVAELVERGQHVRIK